MSCRGKEKLHCKQGGASPKIRRHGTYCNVGCTASSMDAGRTSVLDRQLSVLEIRGTSHNTGC